MNVSSNLRIHLWKLDIPGGITPNGDNVNDTWNILNIERYPDNEVSIYTRAGIRIYQSSGYTSEWDGIYNGEVLPAGPYYFVIKIPKFDRKYTGTVSILR